MNYVGNKKCLRLCSALSSKIPLKFAEIPLDIEYILLYAGCLYPTLVSRHRLRGLNILLLGFEHHMKVNSTFLIDMMLDIASFQRYGCKTFNKVEFRRARRVRYKNDIYPIMYF